MEWNNGLLAGLTGSEADKSFLCQKAEGSHMMSLQVQNHILILEQGQTFWSKLLCKYEKKENIRLCIVSHGGMINMLFRSFMMLPVNTDIKIVTGDTEFICGK